ncbi:MAG: VWA domain-containing protein [Sedimentisphaerales bacterium]|nr:VWA domain-containing protein [Sedimentisphaerales bacterium]
MILLYPIWLLLILPLGAVLMLCKMPTRFLQILRSIILILVVLALCGLAVRLPSRAGTVVIVVDRSLSMPSDGQEKAMETYTLIQTRMKSMDKLAVVSFGEKAAIEKLPENPDFKEFVNEVGPNGSNLTSAIETALALIPQDRPGRLLILSDGRWTGRDPIKAVGGAAARGIAVDYRLLERTTANDLAISHIDAPQNVTPGEGFMVTAWIDSPVGQEIEYEFVRDNIILSRSKRAVPSGLSSMTFRDRALVPGVLHYTLQISEADSRGPGDDPMPENNRAKLLVGVEGPRPILCLSPAVESGLAQLLQSGGLEINASQPENANWTLDELARYSAVLLEDTPANTIGESGMVTLATWITETGAGLMMTGGKSSFGPGGYFRSPLEPIMPVSMELRREHRKLSLAIVVALDRSGSMTMTVSGGKTKMDLANLAAAQVLDLLSSMDEMGVVAVDSSPHIIARCRPIDEDPDLRNRILRIDSRGGGIYVYEALKSAAQMIQDAKAGTRHIILFADAADAEQPGEYRELLERSREAGITVSVIGLGKETDPDADFLRDVAHRGEGRIYFTENAQELPRLFAQDTFVVARSSFIEDPTPLQFTGGMAMISGKRFLLPPPMGGYNLCYIREGANLAAVTVDEYEAPAVATWQAGMGRVACYTGQADGEFAGPIVQWDQIGDLYTSLARWTAGEAEFLGEDLLLTQKVEKGMCIIQLHLDPDRQGEPFNRNPQVNTLKGPPGRKPEVVKQSLRWVDADTLEAQVPLGGNETLLSTVEIEDIGKSTLAPICLPYSPEFKPVTQADARYAMEKLARASSGRERIELAGIWDDLPRQGQLIDISRWLALGAVVLLLLEVLERRTGLLSLQRRGKKAEEQDEEPEDVHVRKSSGLQTAFKRIKAKPARPVKPQTTAASVSTPEQKPEKTTQGPQPKKEKPGEQQPASQGEDMLDALQQARRQARHRKR